MCTCMCVCMCMCLCMHIHFHVCVCMYRCVCLFGCMYTCGSVHMWLCGENKSNLLFLENHQAPCYSLRWIQRMGQREVARCYCCLAHLSSMSTPATNEQQPKVLSQPILLKFQFSALYWSQQEERQVYLHFPSPHMPWNQHSPSALVHIGGPPVYLQRKPRLPCKAQN